MTATDTEAALLAAIRENPGDIARWMVYADALADAGRELDAIMHRIIAEPGRDEWRLDYAAELERAAGEVGCEYGYGEYPGNHSQCSRCHGTGRVSDGRAELAEFVRVQVELAARDDERCRCRECQPTGQHTNGPCRSPLKPLRRRERELWPAVRGAFAGEGWVACLEDSSFGKGEATSPGNVIVLVSRGFPAIVRCTLGQWRGGECENCGGFGEFRRRHDNGDGPEGPCPDCGGKWNSGPHDDPDDYWDKGTGRTPGIGPRLAQTWPVVAVEVTDDPLHLPSEITNRFPPGQYTPDQFRLTLSDALLAWARGQADHAETASSHTRSLDRPHRGGPAKGIRPPR